MRVPWSLGNMEGHWLDQGSWHGEAPPTSTVRLNIYIYICLYTDHRAYQSLGVGLDHKAYQSLGAGLDHRALGLEYV